MTVRQGATGHDSVASLGEEIRLLVDMVVEHAAPWLESMVAAGHRGTAGHPGAAGEQGWPSADPDVGGGASGVADGAAQSGAAQSGAEAGEPSAAGQESAAGNTSERAGTAGNTAENDAHERPIACGWCPLCAVVAVARGERPELSVRALEQAAQMVALLRAVLADRWFPGEGVHMPGFKPEEAESESEPLEPPTMQAARERARPDARADSRPDTRAGQRASKGPRVQHIAVRKVGVPEQAQPDDPRG